VKKPRLKVPFPPRQGTEWPPLAEFAFPNRWGAFRARIRVYFETARLYLRQRHSIREIVRLREGLPWAIPDLGKVFGLEAERLYHLACLENRLRQSFGAWRKPTAAVLKGFRMLKSNPGDGQKGKVKKMKANLSEGFCLTSLRSGEELWRLGPRFYVIAGDLLTLQRARAGEEVQVREPQADELIFFGAAVAYAEAIAEKMGISRMGMEERRRIIPQVQALAQACNWHFGSTRIKAYETLQFKGREKELTQVCRDAFIAAGHEAPAE